MGKQVAGEHIRWLCLLWPKNALRSPIMSKEWKYLQILHADCAILMNPDFWKLFFVMCFTLLIRKHRLWLSCITTFCKLTERFLSTFRMQRSVPRISSPMVLLCVVTFIQDWRSWWRWYENGPKNTVIQFWKRRRPKLIHDYSFVGYILTPNPTIGKMLSITRRRSMMMLLNGWSPSSSLAQPWLGTRGQSRGPSLLTPSFHQQAWHVCPG